MVSCNYFFFLSSFDLFNAFSPPLLGQVGVWRPLDSGVNGRANLGGGYRNLPFLSSQKDKQGMKSSLWELPMLPVQLSTISFCFVFLFFLSWFYCCFLYKFSSFFIWWKLSQFLYYSYFCILFCISIVLFVWFFCVLVVKRLLRFVNGRLHSLLLNVTRDGRQAPIPV